MSAVHKGKARAPRPRHSAQPRLIFDLCQHQPLELRSYSGRTVAMVTARAPAMARVGGPTAGRGARRWSDLLRCSATRRVHRHANGEDEECCMSAAVFLRFLRKRGLERLPPAKRGCGNTGAHALFLRLRLISEASLPVYQRGWGRIRIYGSSQPLLEFDLTKPRCYAQPPRLESLFQNLPAFKCAASERGAHVLWPLGSA